VGGTLRIFVAGASGVIGARLVPLLVADGHVVAGMTRSARQSYGPGTYYPSAPPGSPRIHVDDAARQTLPALTVPPGVTLVADDRAARNGRD